MHSSFILAHEYGHRWGVMGNGKEARVVDCFIILYCCACLQTCRKTWSSKLRVVTRAG